MKENIIIEINHNYINNIMIEYSNDNGKIFGDYDIIFRINNNFIT